ncbi:MAG: glycosyltransferase family 2 protein [Desulfuromonadaceae bacterium]
MPRVSVIIPCYNHGEYLDEAVDSILAQTFRDFEIIIVNDGSTDAQTIATLENYQRPHTRVLHTSNQGLAMARNNGIREACGEFILPLDADDRVAPDYLEKGVAIMDASPGTGIVYCLADCFGAQQGRWDIPEYSPRGMLLTNLIFCCSLFRKSSWEQTAGYNPNMNRGWEDWDFWLSLIERGCTVQRIPEVLFFYRVAPESMVRSMDRKVRVEMHLQLMRNHPGLFRFQSRTLMELYYLLRDSRLYRMAKKLRIPALIGDKMAGGR